MIKRLCGFVKSAGDDSRNRGFTLIEILVASMLLLFAMAGFVPVFLSGLSHASEVRFKSIATNIAREKMEQIRQLDYREIIDADFLEERFETSETQRDKEFTISYYVSEEASDYGAGMLKKVTTSVSWVDTDYVSPASMTTLIHQQYLGPRIKSIEISPLKDDYGDTPFPRLHDKRAGEYPGTTLKIRITEDDWGLVYSDLNLATMAARDVYARVILSDDDGKLLQLGEADEDYTITDLRNHKTDGLVDDVYFYFAFDSDSLPDGYWNLQATAYNQYDEPGNTWRLRVQVENGPPETPTLIATPQTDNETVKVAWSGGAERDRAYYVLQRETWNGAGSWVNLTTLGSALDPDETKYTDQGDIDTSLDPWGTDGSPNYYRYTLWAVDTMDPPRTGTPASCTVVIPDYSTTTTTEPVWETTTTSSTTTTVFSTGSVIVDNQTKNKSFTVTIDGATDYGPYTVVGGEKKTISGIVAGSYNIKGVAPGKTCTASFTLPDDNGDIVLVLSN